MVRGIRSVTPIDPDELSRYKARRKANNDAAKKHRERTRQTVEESKILKDKYDQLLIDFENMKIQLAEVQKEKQEMLHWLCSDECFPHLREKLQSKFASTIPTEISMRDASSSSQSAASSTDPTIAFGRRPFQSSSLADTSMKCPTNAMDMEGITASNSSSPYNRHYSVHQHQMDTCSAAFFKHPSQNYPTQPDVDNRPAGFRPTSFQARPQTAGTSPGTSPIEIWNNLVSVSANSTQLSMQMDQTKDHARQFPSTISSPDYLPQTQLQHPSYDASAPSARQNPIMIICSPDQIGQMQQLFGTVGNTNLTPAMQQLWLPAPAISGPLIASNPVYHELTSSNASCSG